MATLRHELKEAASGGYSRTLQGMVTRGYDVNARDQAGMTSLMYGAFSGHLSVVQLLHRAGCDVKAVDGAGRSALHLACAEGHLDIVEYLTQQMKIKECDGLCKAGLTPLMMAAKCGHASIVRYLVKQCRMDINSFNSERQTALHLAVLSNHIEVVKVLVKLGATVDRRDDPYCLHGDTALICAAKLNYVEIMDFLLRHGADASKPNKHGLTAITVAAREGHVASVKRLLPHSPCVRIGGASMRLSGDSPLVEAASRGHLAVVRLLVSARFTRDLKKAFLAASTAGHLDIMELFLAHMPGLVFKEVEEAILIPRLYQDAFLAAVINNRIDVVQLLIDKGVVDVSGWSTGGSTAIHKAVQAGLLDMVAVLVAAGARVNAPDQEYEVTPLLMAASLGYTHIMRVLLSACRCPKGRPEHPVANSRRCLVCYEEILAARDLQKNTALHCAVRHDQRDVIEFIFDTSLEKDARNIYGQTALHVALSLNNVSAAVLLMQDGADLTIADNNGDQPITLALVNHALACVWYILDQPCHGYAYDTANWRWPYPHIETALNCKPIMELLLGSIVLQRDLYQLLSAKMSLLETPLTSQQRLLLCELVREPLPLVTLSVKAVRRSLTSSPKSLLVKQLPLPTKIQAQVALLHFSNGLI